MGSDAKIRFAVSAEGELKQVLAVAERSNGDLLIFPQEGDTTELPGKVIKRLASHYSVHRNPNSAQGSITIKYTAPLEGGGEMTVHQLRLRNGDEFRALVTARVPPWIADPACDIKPRSKDTVVMLYDQDIGSLLAIFYLLIVSDHGLEAAELSWLRLAVTQHDFEFFRLTVLSGFFLVPGIQRGVILDQPTRPMSLDGSRRDFGFPDEKLSAAHTSGTLLFACQIAIQQLAAAFWIELQKWAAQEGGADPDFMSQMGGLLSLPNYSAAPLVPQPSSEEA